MGFSEAGLRDPCCRGLDGVGAGTATAAFRRQHQSLRRNNPQPTAAADAFELNSFIGFHVPNAMIEIPEKHAVIAGSHVPAFHPIWQFDI